MENEELDNMTYTRADVITILQDELENIPDEEVPNFFADVIIRYLDKLFDSSKFDITVGPYIMGPGEVVGYDENGYEIVKAQMKKLDNTMGIPADAQVYWLTSFKLYYRDSNVMPRIGELFDPYKLRQFLIALLLEQPALVFPGVEKPEVDIMLNIIADMAEGVNTEEDNEPEQIDDDDEIEDDDSDFEPEL